MKPRFAVRVCKATTGLVALVVIMLGLVGCAMPGGHRPTPAPVLAMNDAVEAGDLAKCKQLVALDPELIRTPDGSLRQTPLHRASFTGQPEVVAWLLAHSVEVDARDRFGSTPLSGAAFGGHTRIAETLLDHGADVNASDEDGYAPLDLAASQQHLETAKSLVARGASIAGGPSGMDPIFCFAKAANRDGVEWTLSRGARIATDDMLNGWTAMHWLAKGPSLSREEALALRLSGDDPRAEERSARELEDARYAGVVRVLVEHGADVDALGDSKDQVPLHLAASADNLAIATALLDAGARIDPRDEDGKTPLALAADLVHGEMVELLVVRGADVDTKDRAGFTPLITATRWGEGEAAIREVVEALIAGGADVNARTPGGGWGPAGHDGHTALQQAAEFGHPSVVELLLRSGADANMGFADGRTPLYWAAKNGHADVVTSLVANGADVNAEAKGRTALGAARDGKHGEIVAMLLAHGARD